MKDKSSLISVFLISVAVLGAELSIIRYMSVAGWSNFSGMIISIAMLGFGLSGTLLTVFRERLEKRIDDWMFWVTGLFVLTIGVVLQIVREIPFIPHNLHQDTTQIVYLALYYLLFFIPFFFGAMFINLAFLRMKTGINRLYLYNLIGSGVGGFLMLLLTSWIVPQYLLVPILLVGSAALFVQGGCNKRRLLISVAVTVLALLPSVFSPEFKMSPFKDISYALKVPNSKIIHQSPSSLGYIQVIESSQFHFAPGLAVSFFESSPPVQHGLFIDGFSASGVARMIPDNETAYIRHLAFSLPFSIRTNAKSLVVGAGGGNPILFALKLGASKVTAVEPNGPIISLASETFGAYSDGIWNNPKVSVVNSDGRSFCKKTDERFDIITIPALFSSGISFSSGSGHGENYLFTKEALDDYEARLLPDGIVDISMGVDSPPRTLLKLEALVFGWLKDRHPSDFRKRVVFLRGMDWGTMLIKNGLFTDAEIRALHKKAKEMSVDFSYYDGIKPEETNKYNMIEDELYYKFAQSFIDGTERQFIDNYAFNIEAPTDNRPFFNHFLQLSTVPKLLGMDGGMKGVPFSEWGYLLSWATVLQGIIFSLLIISVPVFTSGRKFLKERGKFKVITYFLSLGMGFMMIEIAVIQKLNLLIANPLYSVAVTISALMIFSGIGAGFAQRYCSQPKKGIKIGVAGIIGALALHAFVIAPLVPPLLGLPELVRIILAIAFIAPLGFFMGFPYPLGLQVLSDKREVLMPWGLAINGSVSVFAAVLTTILSMHFGFVFVFVLSTLFYLLAFVTFPARIRFSE